MNRNRIFVISAPSGTGKGTIINEILNKRDNLYYSISMTTRSPRIGEVEGKHYYYVSREEFLKKLDAGEVLEYTEYCGNFYGTPLDVLKEKLSENISCILEIDTVGAFNIKEKWPDAVLIFIAPPSEEVLAHRLRKRNTETEEAIAGRIARAREEMLLKDKFDYIVVNDELDKAVSEVMDIINFEESRN